MTGRLARMRRTARTTRILSSVAAILFIAGCTNYYEIPIETPIKPKLDVSAFQRVLVAGFIAGGTDDVDGNLETTRLLRSQLRTKSELRVIDTDVLPLMDVAVQENAPPLLNLVHWHLDLASDLVDRFTPDDPQHDFRLALRAPPLGQCLVSAFRRHHRL